MYKDFFLFTFISVPYTNLIDIYYLKYLIILDIKYVIEKQDLFFFVGFMSRYRDLNWNRNWKNSPRYSDIINDNTYPSSLINYDKEYSDVRSSVSSRFGEHSPIQEHISIPNEDEQFRGKFYNYGNAFGYNDNYMSSPRESYYEKHENLQMAQKCSIKIVSGSKLSRSILRKTCVAHDLEQCEEFCINETDFSCKSFAYR